MCATATSNDYTIYQECVQYKILPGILTGAFLYVCLEAVTRSCSRFDQEYA
jgi:hypothetical protein